MNPHRGSGEALGTLDLKLNMEWGGDRVGLGSEDEHPVKEMNEEWFGSLRRLRKSVWREVW